MPHTRIVSNYDLGPEGPILIASLEADPAAGQEITITVPGRAVWEVMAIRFTLAADGTAATRTVALHIDDGENRFLSIARANTQIANDTDVYVFYVNGGEDTTTGTAFRQPLPPKLILLPGWRITTETNNMQAGDNFSAPVLYVREVPQRGLAVGQEALLSALRRLIGEEAFSG